MYFKKSLYALAATLSLIAVEAKDSCSFSKTTITAASAVSELNACSTLKGDIQITGDEIASIDLSTVEEISGKINFFNSSSVTDINLNKLDTISGSLNVQALTQLHSIDFSSLSEVEKLSLISLPSFAIINLNTGVSKATSIEVSDTALSSLQGLTNFDTIGTLDINNNKNISSIELAQLKSVSEGLILSFNSDDCEVKLDDLKWASNLTLQDISDVSVGNLTKVNGTFVVAYNSFQQIDFSALKTVGGSLQVFGNDELEEVSFEKLKEIEGEFRIFNNSELTDISLKKLETVTGAVNIKGKFDNFTLPSLKEVDGDFTVVSTSDDFSCSSFNKLHKKKKIEGHNYSCSAPKKSKSKSKSSSKSGSDSSESGSSSSSNDDSSSSGSSSSSSSSTSSSKSSDGNVLIGSTMMLATIVGTVMAVFI